MGAGDVGVCRAAVGVGRGLVRIGAVDVGGLDNAVDPIVVGIAAVVVALVSGQANAAFAAVVVFSVVDDQRRRGALDRDVLVVAVGADHSRPVVARWGHCAGAGRQAISNRFTSGDSSNRVVIVVVAVRIPAGGWVGQADVPVVAVGRGRGRRRDVERVSTVAISGALRGVG